MEGFIRLIYVASLKGYVNFVIQQLIFDVQTGVQVHKDAEKRIVIIIYDFFIGIKIDIAS